MFMFITLRVQEGEAIGARIVKDAGTKLRR